MATNTSSTTTTLFGEYTDRHHRTVAPLLMMETKLINEINEIRSDLGLSAARNVYPWWTYTLVALTYFPAGKHGYCAMTDIDEFLKEAKINVKNLRQHSTLLNNSIEGMEPSKVAREYTGRLPKLVRLLRLRSERLTPANYYGRGRCPIAFRFEDPAQARTTLLREYPDTIHLFAQLDYYHG